MNKAVIQIGGEGFGDFIAVNSTSFNIAKLFFIFLSFLNLEVTLIDCQADHPNR